MTDIIPLTYELKKAKPELLNNEAMYHGMALAYTGGNIGPISNNITKVWNTENIQEEQLNVVKWLTYVVNQTIDYSKTLWKVDPPKEIKKIIQSYTKSKVPNFFIYAKDKKPSVVEPVNNSSMNRIAGFIPDSHIKFNKSIGKLDYRVLLNANYGFDLSESSSIIKLYDYWNVKINSFVEDKKIKNQEMYKYYCLRNKIIEESAQELNYIVNTLVMYLYTIRKTSAKKGLWDGFGDILVQNIKQNLVGKNNVCPICGKRFSPVRSQQIYCDENCYRIAKNERKK